MNESIRLITEPNRIVANIDRMLNISKIRRDVFWNKTNILFVYSDSSQRNSWHYQATNKIMLLFQRPASSTQFFHLVNYSNSYRALISKYIWLSIGNDNYFAVNFTGAKVIHVDKCARSKRMEIKPSNQSILSMNVNVWVKVWFVIELIRWRYIKGECPAHSIELIIKVFIVSDDSKSKSCSKYVFQVS